MGVQMGWNRQLQSQSTITPHTYPAARVVVDTAGDGSGVVVTCTHGKVGGGGGTSNEGQVGALEVTASQGGHVDAAGLLCCGVGECEVLLFGLHASIYTHS